MKMRSKYFLLIIVALLMYSCIDDSSLYKITQTSSGTYEYPSWSPDGKQVAVIYEDAGTDAELQLYDLSTNTWSQLTTEDRRFWSISWLDKDKIAYVVDMPSVGVSKLSIYSLTDQEKRYEEFNSFIVDLSASATDNKLAMVRDALNSEIDDEEYGITIFDTETKEESILFVPEKDRNVSEVAWSPDGQIIAFTTNSPNPAQTNRVNVYSLSIINLTDNKISAVITDAQMTIEGITWSLDGRNIVARIIDNNYKSFIGSISMDGTITYADTHDIDFVDVVSSPSEDILVLTSLGAPDTNAMYLMRNPFSFTNE